MLSPLAKDTLLLICGRIKGMCDFHARKCSIYVPPGIDALSLEAKNRRRIGLAEFNPTICVACSRTALIAGLRGALSYRRASNVENNAGLRIPEIDSRAVHRVRQL